MHLAGTEPRRGALDLSSEITSKSGPSSSNTLPYKSLWLTQPFASRSVEDPPFDGGGGVTRPHQETPHFSPRI